MSAPEEPMEQRPECSNCGRELRWHVVGRCWVHADVGHYWCTDEQGYHDRPKATPGGVS